MADGPPRSAFAPLHTCPSLTPVVLPLDALVPEDVAVVAPCWVGDVDGLALEEAGDEAGADAEGSGAREGLEDSDSALCEPGERGGAKGGPGVKGGLNDQFWFLS